MPTPNDNDRLRTTNHEPNSTPASPDVTTHFAQGLPPVNAETAAYVPGQGTKPKGTETDRAAASVAVPGYEIETVLGRGGMGVVYKAHHLALKRTVALKMVLAGGHAGPRELARFRIEAEAVARLQHPNIVQIHEIDEADGHPYCALEFVAGGNLKGKIEGKPMPARESARLVEALARAMQLAHSRNVVHRDLKPANILLAADGTPKITDFGLARQMDSDSGETQAGAVMGTPSYMAPEQASGRAHEAGPAADVYALGAILYACLTGRPPFKGKTVVETLDQVRTQEPVPPSRWQTSVSLDLETICLKCLRKEPENRYASAAELADDLHRYQNGEPIQARPVGMVERMVKWVRRRPAIATLWGALATVVVGAFALVAWQLEETRAALELGEKQSRERALAQVNTLRNAAPGAVPSILADVERHRADVLPKLREFWAEGGDQPTRMRLALALLPVEPELVSAELVASMLTVEDPAEVLLAREALLPLKAQLTGPLWTKAEDANVSEAERFRALAALAAFDPDNLRWSKTGPASVEGMLRANPFYLASWAQALRPVRPYLLESLREVFRGQKLAEYQKLATSVLADYAVDQPQVLADLLMDADEKQFAVIYPKFKEQTEQGLPLLIGEIDKQLPADLPSSDEKRERLGKRQANAAVALLKLQQSEKAWLLLKHSPDPRARSYLIHRLSSLGVGALAILKHLEKESDLTICRALLLSLGEYGERELSPEDRKAVLPKLQDIYRTAADPGLHGAAEWLLRQWQQEAWLKQLNEEWAIDKEQRQKRLQGIQGPLTKDKNKTLPQWYVNGQGQTMVVIPGPVEFLMGSPSTEEGGQSAIESQHKRRIGRTFALAAKPVTVKEFRRFLESNKLEAWFESGGAAPLMKRYSPDENGPIILVDWYRAAAYCNWLSEQEGIPPEQWCYETNALRLSQEKVSATVMMLIQRHPLTAAATSFLLDRQPQVTALRKNYLSLTGYRLPTEAEWEYACRAEAVTSRYYGETEELLPKYAWYRKNSQSKTWPVGTLKPNDFGLFDMHGSVYNWCQERYLNYPQGEQEDREDAYSVIRLESRLLRNGSFASHALTVRSAYRASYVPEDRGFNIGFRPARTYR
jgi:formylglycine-generating enzyme required for sulfatase activity